MTIFVNVKAILQYFEAVSGLKVNFFKSEIFGVQLSILSSVHLMGCKAGSLPTSYLGRLLHLESASKDLWNPVIERVERKLAPWKTNYLCMGGCITH